MQKQPKVSSIGLNSDLTTKNKHRNCFAYHDFIDELFQSFRNY